MLLFSFLVLGLVIGYLWRLQLRQEHFVTQVTHSHKWLTGLCASLVAHYKADL